jgi:hypothetical protein
VITAGNASYLSNACDVFEALLKAKRMEITTTAVATGFVHDAPSSSSPSLSLVSSGYKGGSRMSVAPVVSGDRSMKMMQANSNSGRGVAMPSNMSLIAMAKKKYTMKIIQFLLLLLFL